TSNSQAGRAFWSNQLGVGADQIRVFYNGVDVEEFRPPVEAIEVPRIGVLARLHVANGHEWLIDALGRLDTLVSQPWRCIFAGIGPENARLRTLVSRRRLEHRIEFAGHCSDPPAFLRSLQIAVHPSFVSGMPNAVLEAMATAVPVVATAVGGTPEVIQDKLSGFLVQPRDVMQTADYLALLLTRGDLRVQLGKSARQRVVTTFSVQAMVRTAEDLIDDLVSARLGLRYAPPSGWMDQTGRPL